MTDMKDYCIKAAAAVLFTVAGTVYALVPAHRENEYSMPIRDEEICVTVTPEIKTALIDDSPQVTDSCITKEPEVTVQADASQASEDISDGLININTADKNELQNLPGIGPGKAEAIIEYRRKYGDFEENEDIMKVPGIKEGTFRKLKDRIKCK